MHVTRFRCLILTVLLTTISLSLEALSISGQVTQERVIWNNVISVPDGLAPSTWSIKGNIVATQKWRPGLFSSIQSDTVNLTGPGGAIVNAPLKVSGLEYNLGGVSPSVENTPIGNECSVANYMGNIVHLFDVNMGLCFANFNLINPSLIKPFYFLRPIFTLNNTDLITAFKDKPAGVYIGRIPLTIRYNYYTKSGTLTYQNIQESLSVQLNYDPSVLTSIDVIGNGLMIPVYDQLLKKVSASTTFDINANGYFSNGLRVSFEQKNYILTGPTDIPYSITCTNGCSQRDIVTKGTLDHPVILVTSNSQTNIRFGLDIDYTDININDVETGNYTDTFIVTFEANF